MYDIKFFESVLPLKERIVARDFSYDDVAEIERALEDIRDPQPHVFNIETTNYCNMRCVMCPRTALMTRKNIWINDESFIDVLNQMKSHPTEDINGFWDFVDDKYGIKVGEESENGFYFHVVSWCVILHGYGEPLLDKKIVERVQACTDRKIPTYFSCVPANISVEKTAALMQAGLTVLKFSMDALSDEMQKRIRGRYNNFDKSYDTILEILDFKAKKGFDTKIVITMIELVDREEAREMHEEFLKLWKDHDVFAYIKSQDNRWYFEEDSDMINKSHYEQQYCEFPWTSLTVMADGSVVPCTQDYDTEMVFGNVREQSLAEIWNSEKYKEFRRWHITGDFPKGHKCVERCDQKKLYSYLKNKSAI